jgi:hypothetical protein
LKPGEVAVWRLEDVDERMGHVHVYRGFSKERPYPRIHVKYHHNALRTLLWNARVTEYEDQPYFERPYLCGDFGVIDYQRIYQRFATRYPELLKEDPAPFYDAATEKRFTCEQARRMTKLLQYIPRISQNQLP